MTILKEGWADLKDETQARYPEISPRPRARDVARLREITRDGASLGVSTWQEGEGAWEGHWFTLNSGGELKVFPDAESTEEQMAVQINLKEV